MSELLAIIGTAGRKDDYAKLNKENWLEVKKLVRNFIRENKITQVISGGAAFADHLAVNLYNAKIVENLTLCLPAEFNLSNKKFKENGFKSSGSIANYYHRRFSEKIYDNEEASLNQIYEAIQGGCEAISWSNFWDRNAQVANLSTMILAITFGNGNIVKDGGTAHTCKLFIQKNGSAKAFHLNLYDMKIHDNAIVE